MARVVLENLTKMFRGADGQNLHAVSGVTLSVERGEFMTLVGPTGCGKTTVLRLIAGLEVPTRGRILLDGVDVTESPPRDRNVAMVFQQHALYPHLTAFENAALGLKLRGLPRAEVETRVREVTALLGLEECLGRRPGELSGGQRQRVALARAMVRRPKVLLLDEPLSDLDAPMRDQLRNELARHRRRCGATTIHVTHDRTEAMMLGDRLAVLRQGVVQQLGEPLAVYHAPANKFVAGFLGSPPMNMLRGVLAAQEEALWFCAQESANSTSTVGGLRLRVDRDMIATLLPWSGKAVDLGVRPEHIRRSNPVSDRDRGQTAEAVVETVEETGSEQRVRFTTGAHSIVARFPAGEKTSAGQSMALTFDMREVYFFDPATELTLC